MTTSPIDPNRSADWLFDAETAIQPAGPGRWKTLIRADWNIDANPNGGYALTPLLRAMAADAATHSDSGAATHSDSGAASHSDPVSLTTHFLRPAIGGEVAELSTEVVRRGRRTSTVRGTMTQQGKARVEIIGTFYDLSSGEVGPALEHFVDSPALRIQPPELLAPDDCVHRLELSQGVRLPLMSRVEVRIDPRFADPGSAGEATTAGWIRFADGRAPDSMALPLFSDSFPPSLFGLVGRTGWVPTIELTVHVRRRPAPGWIRGRFTTRDMAGGMVVEDGVLWDSTDRVVAQARQLAMVAS